MILDLVSNLVVILDVDASILEDALLHLHMIQQGVLRIETMEEATFVDNWLALARYVSVVFVPCTNLSQPNDALARFDQIHARWPLICPCQEFAVSESDHFEVEGNAGKHLLLDISEHIEALQEGDLLV